MFKCKRVIVIGLAKSGVSTLKALSEVGAIVTINDLKTEDKLSDILAEIDGLYTQKILGSHPTDYSNIDMMVLSPGVPTDLKFINDAREQGVEIIGELELSYRLSNSKKFIGITGTNGKTTTTALVGKMFSDGKVKSHVVGNIGIPAVSVAMTNDKDDYMITEVSSFQLETISNFKTQISAILNVTPDHLNRHKTMENYIDAKCRIFENHDNDGILILNYDNEITRNIKENAPKSRVLYFAKDRVVEDGAYTLNGKLYIADIVKNETIEVIDSDQIFIPGPHNLENAMAAVLIAYHSGISTESIRFSLKDFKGVEHRIEFVRKIGDVSYFNDSKGTNPDASIVAVRAMDGPSILIAGGMDKGSEFDEFVDSFGEKIKLLVLFGETKNLIADSAKNKGFENFHIVNNLKEAVEYAYDNSSEIKNVLLSPACASWDMYESFEKRGEEFKQLVNSLRG